MKNNRNKNGRLGFTLIEVLLAMTVLVVCLTSILLTYVHMFILSDLSRDLTLSTNAVQDKMEEIKKTDFDSLSALNGTTFDITGFAASDAKGLIQVIDTAYADLKRIRLVACFKSRRRIIGEDANLNGVLNAGEDTNANGRLDSPVELVTLISR